MPLPAGALSQRIDIEQRSLADDSEGGQVLTWTTLATDVPANVTPDAPMSGEQPTEYLRAGRMVAVSTYRIRMRWRDDVSSENRVVWKGHKIDLRSAHNVDGRNEELQLTGVETEAGT